MNRPTLSVIIPTINEADHLPELLSDIASQQEITIETIIADGGSSDATLAVAETGNARLVKTERGRGRQMNTAACQAGGEYLLFMHADSRMDNIYLLYEAVEALHDEIAEIDRNEVAGHFRLRFIRSNSQNTSAYRYAEGKSAFNRPNTTNGDQGLLLTKEFFHRLGGFDESLPFLEDQRIAEKIHSCGKMITLPGYLWTSARRFEAEGFHRRYILMSMMMGLSRAGVDSFFVRAPEVYQLQLDTGKLFLSPFFGIIRQMMCSEWGVFGTIRIFYNLGSYIRENSWQMFYFFDICCRPLIGRGRFPFLRFHDQFFAPLTNFRTFNAMAGILCFIWFMGILAPFFWLYDYQEMKLCRSR